MRCLIRPLFCAAIAIVASFQTGDAQEPAQSPTLLQPAFAAPAPSLQESRNAVGVLPRDEVSSELPASIRNPGEILSLATAGPPALPSVPMQSMGCNPKPHLRCLGPDFCGCSPRIYYGTNPCDDDPVLTMSPAINGPLTRYWYRNAWDMVVRKKAIAAATNK